jgi:hypothetical protein
MITLLSLVTSIKDYVEVLHKLVETNSTNGITTYYDLGATLTFSTLLFKEGLLNFLSFKWIENIWSIPTLIPDIASSMISEISVFNGMFQDSFTFLEKPLSYGNQNLFIYCLEKFIIGILNSIFLCFATSTSSIITLRRFVMQGLEAGYMAGLGSIFGNLVWIGSIIFGFRFIVIPWLSLDILRYILGFILLVKYMWDNYSERRSSLTDLSKTKIFLLNFLLAFTEQTNIFPFLNNLSIGSDSTLLETFPTLTSSSLEFFFVHGCYLLGILLGSLSLLQFTCWFWENPAYNLYMWTISSFKVTTSFYYKFLNFIFLYLTMICTINSIGYFGLDYTLTNPLGFVHEDRVIEQKLLLETSFLNSKASDRNTRRNRGRHGRRERWKRRVRSYRTFDASIYDQGIYDLFTIEDLNYGFDRFWLRRKIRNHRVRFRFFPGPWMRSLKKQFARPRLESFMGPRVEFFRILFEQAYDPEFHEFQTNKDKILKKSESTNLFGETSFFHSKSRPDKSLILDLSSQNTRSNFSIYGLSQNRTSYNKKDYYSNIGTNSFLRKFLRKADNRLKLNQVQILEPNNFLTNNSKLYSKNLKFFQGFENQPNIQRKDVLEEHFFENFYRNLFQSNFSKKNSSLPTSWQKNNTQKKFSKSDQFITQYKSFLQTNNLNSTPLTLLHPLKFYIQKDEAFRKKCKFYGVKQFRNYSVENNAPYFRVMMKRFFYHYKPTLRWERTMRVATMRKARRKGSRIPRKWNVNSELSTLANLDSTKLKTETNNSKLLIFDSQKPDDLKVSINSLPQASLEPIEPFPSTQNINQTNIQKPTHFYSLVSKKASRYRYQIYKDVLQHWYYSKMNRLLLKFDVDSFIRRQPKPHFLTKNEETLLHVKRFLLFEYYNSLRWYNSMQHYQTMKTTIGKTKSLGNRAYNQQFFGTFKKIRHLFAISPSFNQTVLKFDQPLYNEFSNTSSKSIVSESLIHEELKTLNEKKLIDLNQSKEFISSAKNFIQDSLKEKNLVRQNTIQSLLLEKNYADLTKFLFTENQSNIRPFLNQDFNCSTEFCSSLGETKTKLFANKKHSLGGEQSPKTLSGLQTRANLEPKSLTFALLKKCQNKLYDQKALKNFVLSKVEKNEKLKQRKEKNLRIRLEKLKDWYTSSDSERISPLNTFDFSSTIAKAMKEAYNITPRNKKRIIKENLTKNNLNEFSLITKRTKENLKTKILSFNQTFSNQHFPPKPKRLNYKKWKITSISKKMKKWNFTNQKSLRIFDFLLVRRSRSKANVNYKNFNNWRQTEKVLSKRKKIRKTFKRLKNVQNFYFSDNNSLRNNLNSFNEKIFLQNRKKLDTYKNKKNWQLYNNQEKRISIEWKKRRSRIRRYKFFKGRGPIKKRTLGEKLKNKFRFLKKYGSIHTSGPSNNREFSSDKPLMKTYDIIFQTITKNSSKVVKENNLELQPSLQQERLETMTPEQNLFEMRPIKQSRTLIKKHRYWKKHKKPIFAQNKRKLRKRRRYLKAKIRVLTKKLKSIEFHSFIKKWWVRTTQAYILSPNLQNNQVSVPNKNFVLNSNYFQEFQENPKFPNEGAALFIRPDTANSSFHSNKFSTIVSKPRNQIPSDKVSLQKNPFETITMEPSVFNTNTGSQVKLEKLDSSFNLQKMNQTNDVVKQLMQNVFSSNQPLNNIHFENLNQTPFYVGWDESSRKFVVTNRLLSRKNAGYSYLDKNTYRNFTNGFLNSMNAATTLYWQIPFTTYDPDQFFALGMDGFSPLGWKNFTFKFSQRTTKPILVKKMATLPHFSLTNVALNSTNFSENLEIKVLKNQFGYILDQTKRANNLQPTIQTNFSTERFNQINQYRRIQKRYKRVKKHPRPPVWFPSGPLTSQILPVHYIYVFYKRYRLPRDRYVRRRLRANKSDSFTMATATTNRLQLYNYTLRKRVKPKRKYHRKNFKFLRKNENLVQTIFRRQFRDYSTEKIHFRPSSSFILKESDIKEKMKPRKKTENKNKLSNKSSRDNLRLRQLRRRVQRQVFRPVWRYKPQAGGFIWPGDYLRLDQIKAPKLQTIEKNTTQEFLKSEAFRESGFSETKTKKQRKIRKKKRRIIPEWQIQPKKYLLTKHNMKVLKKRLEKSQNKFY